jgi:hypothetical protein
VKRDWWVGRGADDKGYLGFGYLGFAEVEGRRNSTQVVLFYDNLIVYFRQGYSFLFLRL